MATGMNYSISVGLNTREVEKAISAIGNHFSVVTAKIIEDLNGVGKAAEQASLTAQRSTNNVQLTSRTIDHRYTAKPGRWTYDTSGRLPKDIANKMRKTIEQEYKVPDWINDALEIIEATGEAIENMEPKYGKLARLITWGARGAKWGLNGGYSLSRHMQDQEIAFLEDYPERKQQLVEMLRVSQAQVDKAWPDHIAEALGESYRLQWHRDDPKAFWREREKIKAEFAQKIALITQMEEQQDAVSAMQHQTAQSWQDLLAGGKIGPSSVTNYDALDVDWAGINADFEDFEEDYLDFIQQVSLSGPAMAKPWQDVTNAVYRTTDQISGGFKDAVGVVTLIGAQTVENLDANWQGHGSKVLTVLDGMTIAQRAAAEDYQADWMAINDELSDGFAELGDMQIDLAEDVSQQQIETAKKTQREMTDLAKTGVKERQAVEQGFIDTWTQAWNRGYDALNDLIYGFMMGQKDVWSNFAQSLKGIFFNALSGSITDVIKSWTSSLFSGLADALGKGFARWPSSRSPKRTRRRGRDWGGGVIYGRPLTIYPTRV